MGRTVANAVSAGHWPLPPAAHRGLSPDHHCVWSTPFLRRTCAGFLLLLLLLKLNSPEQIADVDEY